MSKIQHFHESTSNFPVSPSSIPGLIPKISDFQELTSNVPGFTSNIPVSISSIPNSISSIPVFQVLTSNVQIFIYWTIIGIFQYTSLLPSKST
jgi:hypothetical protein